MSSSPRILFKFRSYLVILISIFLIACQEGSDIDYPDKDDTQQSNNTNTPVVDNSGEFVGSPSPAPEEPVDPVDPGLPVNNTPSAKNDAVVTDNDVPVNINVLGNDSGLEDGDLLLSVIAQPTNGVTAVETDNTITYTPKEGYSGVDSFSYQVKDQDNDAATATVSISINCTNCTAAQMISLTWNENLGVVDGYRVFFGLDPKTADNEVANTTTTFAEFDTQLDLNLQEGETACFRLKAYNSLGESGYSDAICTVI